MQPRRWLVLCLLFFVAGGGVCWGQILEGTISGLVKDPTGAVLPGVEITLVHVERGTRRTTVTNDEGRYYATSLPVGTYEIIAELPGFKRYERKDVRVDAGSQVRVDITMEVGEITESITVTGGAPLIQLETGEVSKVIETEQLKELAIQGRNFVGLAALVPGVSNQLPDEVGVGVTGGTGGLYINGTRAQYSNWTVDGGWNTDVGNQASLMNYPAMEAVGEFRIMTSNYSAEYGSAGAGVVAVVTRSGEREFHGSVYEIHRNDALDAANFFAAIGPDGEKAKQPLIWNNYGFTLGGPIYIPGKYNEDKTKDFFFWSEEWKKRRSGTVVRAATPTQAMREGDFSAVSTPIIDPLTGEPFPGNIIPADRLNPNSKILLDLAFPLPNVTTGEFLNFNLSPKVPQNFRQDLIRWDHNFTDDLKMVVRYIQDSFDEAQVTTLWTGSSFPNISSTISSPADNFLVKLTHVLSPTLVHEFNFSFAGNDLALGLTGPYERPSNLTLQEMFPENRANRIPNITLGQGWGDVSLGSWPWTNFNSVYTWDDKWTIIRGNHSFKFGGLFQWQLKDQDAFGATHGAYTFDGKFTGHAVADFVLGMPSSYSELDIQRTGQYRYWQTELFVQDDWRVSPNFTLNLGLRYFYIPALYEKNRAVTSFVPSKWDPNLAPELVPTSGAIVPDTGDLLNGLVQAGTGGLSKYMTENSKTDFAPRVGFSWNPEGLDRLVFRGGYGIGYYRVEGNVLYNFITYPPFAQTVTVNNPPMEDPAAGAAAPKFPPEVGRFEDKFDPPQVHQWSFGIQINTSDILFRDSVLEVAYVGSHVSRLPLTRNINQPLPVEGFDFDPEINRGEFSTHYFRPYRGYANIVQRETSGRSNYNSLQVSFDKRFSEGLKFNLAYTFSKAMNTLTQFDSTPQDSYHPELDYALADWDVTHNLTLNYIYYLPFFSGQGGVAEAVLGGWELAGIVVLQSGNPRNIGMALSNTGLATRPDLVGDVEGPETIDQWFNTSAFVQPEWGYFGNAGRNLVRGPDLKRWDFSLMKNWNIPWFAGESARMQFRIEAFNFLNRTNFSGVSTNLGSGNFGALTSARSARIFQAGLKFEF
ncbi:MAG: hypothetical protein Kow00109_02790 [Acidobacteriota bacterium]